jgi:tetratricopeptide (TPR) repeat protein
MPPSGALLSAPVSQGALLAAAAACVVYANALRCGFAFDDNFAVLSNGDVGDPAKPLAALWNNDFWGQDIRSEHSHKSWRPLAVLFMRACRWAGTPEGVPPRPAAFHAANVALHAAVSALTHTVACRVSSLWAAPAAAQSAATAAALLFAVHPVHTEAVTGVVGVAELLSALFCMLGFLAYTGGAPIRGPGDPAGGRGAFAACCRTLLAMLCTACAVLCKETGLTVCGAFILWEGLRACAAWLHDERERQSARQVAAACARLACTLLCAAAYVTTRRRVIGGDTLVKIFRRVENPIAFLPTRTARLLTTGHSHVRYAILLAWPRHLSCDWSHACMQPVVHAFDPRALLLLALYGLLAAPVLHAALAVYRHKRHGAQCQGCASQPPPIRALVRAFVVVAFGAAPFAPAANLLFYVGTFIGERLLYMPSLAFCIVLGDLLCGSDTAEMAPQSPPSHKLRLRWLLTAALCVAAAARTVLRNADWASEEALFLSALTVCPDSAKVLLNSGILARRAQDWPLALQRFTRALEVEPVQYCEPWYWLGVTHINSGAIPQGQDYLQRSLDCKWVAVEAAQALHTLLRARLEANGNDAEAMVLLADLLGRTAARQEACVMYLRAAAVFDQGGFAANASAARHKCQALDAGMAALGDSLLACRRAMEASAGDITAATSKKKGRRRLIRRLGGECTLSEEWLVLIHSWQSSDAYDPDLHVEWARLLDARGGREGEVQAHRQAAAMLTKAKEREEL